MGDLILADFESKTWHRREPQEPTAQDTAPCEMPPFGGAGIDGMPFEAPDRDPA